MTHTREEVQARAWKEYMDDANIALKEYYEATASDKKVYEEKLAAAWKDYRKAIEKQERR